MIFVEARIFTAAATELLRDDECRKLQCELVDDPRKGDVMPGCGGLRKIRVPSSARSKGKRGGSRVIYLYIPEVDRIDLLAIYGKDDQDNLTENQKRLLSELAETAKQEAIRNSTKGRRLS